jgi:hypothetical protein
LDDYISRRFDDQLFKSIPHVCLESALLESPSFNLKISPETLDE